MFISSGNYVRVEGGYGTDFTGLNRLNSSLREREAEIDIFRNRIIEIEKGNVRAENSGVDTERTLASLRA